LRAATQEAKKLFAKSARRGRTSEEARDEAVASLAAVFHKRADHSIDGEYRSAMLSFIDEALSAAKFKALGMGRKPTTKDPTEGRKTWQRVPDEFRTPRRKP
jgi:hypothetical protein